MPNLVPTGDGASGPVLNPQGQLVPFLGAPWVAGAAGWCSPPLLCPVSSFARSDRAPWLTGGGQESQAEQLAAGGG